VSFSRAVHTSTSAEEVADRLAIRELLDAYAHFADRRDAEGQLSLFTADAEVLLIDSGSADPSRSFKGREELRPLFEALRTFEATTHFNGQSTVTWERNFATGVLNCLAHLVKIDGPSRTLTTRSSIPEPFREGVSSTILQTAKGDRGLNPLPARWAQVSATPELGELRRKR
jgi:SnoaL-like domain